MLVALTLIVAGCTGTKRDCPGFFHPSHELWGQQEVGKNLIFTDQLGNSESFKVAQIARSEPFETLGRGARVSSVVCDLSVRELLIRQDLKETILKVFQHGEFSDRSITEESSLIDIFIDQGDHSKYANFTTKPHRRTRNFTIYTTNYLTGAQTHKWSQWKQSLYPELEIGDTLYEDVIKEEIIDEKLLKDAEQMSSIILASGYGIVQYTRVNGSVFSRVLP